ncbi:MAG: hypothetical protein QOE45_2345 [Frankiaceae bacterium]|jgi:hypothetical protein|nr:hypothetical protein [Frankiaceae bacterium]
MTSPRRLLVCAVAAVLAGSGAVAAVAPGAPPFAGALTDVRVAGGGSLALPPDTARDATLSRAGWDDLPRGYVAAGVTPPRSMTGGDEAAVYPPGSTREPGTAVTYAGGNCDGYAARDATISPMRLGVAPDGRVYWTDRDSVVARHGSALLRTVDAGRVRTLGPVLPPDEGRFNRVDEFDEFAPRPVPDGRGGVYVNSAPRPSRGYDDQPASGLVQYVRDDGTRTVVAGGGEQSAADRSLSGSAPGRDGPATSRWLGPVDSLDTLDDRGVFLTEQLSGLHDVIRFVNTGTAPVTFYRGTPAEKTVAPGAIGTLAGHGRENEIVRGTTGLNRPAAEMDNLLLSDVEYRDGLLVALDVELFNEGDGGPSGAPADYVSVWAVNLGLDGRARTVYGTTILPGDAALVAGTNLPSAGTAGGDDIPARGAELKMNFSGYNGGIAVAPDLTLYIAETRAHRIRSIDPATGIISTLAGLGTPGYDGEGVAARLTRLHNPLDVEVAPDGSVLFSEQHTARIRRVTPAGLVETVVGRGPTPCGDGHRAAPGRTMYGGAYFGALTDVAVDSRGNRYVSDLSYNTVRRVRPDGRVDRTFGRPTPCAAGRWGDIDNDSCAPFGTQSPDAVALRDLEFGEPTFLLVDAYDNLYVVDVDRVRYLNVGTRPVDVHGRTVPAGEARTVFALPDRFVRVVTPGATAYHVSPLGDLAVDGRGDLYVADPLLHVVHEVGPCAILRVVAGNGRASARGDEGDGGRPLDASISPAGSLAYDRDRDALLVVDVPSGAAPRVRAVNLSQRRMAFFGRTVRPDRIESVVGGGDRCRSRDACSYGDGGLAREAGISAPSVELAPSGDLYLAERTDRIRVVRRDGVVATIASPVAETDGAPEDTNRAVRPAPREGYGGDGGPALDAVFWLHRTRIGYQRNQTTAAFPGVPGGVAVSYPVITYSGHSGMAFGNDGDLLVADAARLRAVTGAALAPVRVAPPAPAAEVSRFSPPVLLTDDAATVAPALAPGSGESYVTAARGAGRGCATWVVADGGAWRQGAPQPFGAGGRDAGGRACDLALRNGALVVATPLSASTYVAESGAGHVVTRSSDAARTWTGTVLPAPADAAPAVRVTATSTGFGLARTTRDGVTFATSTDGTAFADRGAVAGPVAVLGDLRHDAAGWYVPVVRTVLGQRTVAVAESADGTAWRSTDLWPVPGTESAVSAPATTTGPDGRRHVVWSDRREVRLASGRGGAWAAPVVLPGFAVLPSVASGPRSDLAIGHYTGTTPSGEWRPAVTVVRGGSFTTYLASGAVAFVGTPCVTATCPSNMVGAEPLTGPGPVRIAAAPGGVAQLAYAAGKGAVAVQRACLAASARGCGGAAKPVASPPAAAPALMPALPPDPDLPGCSGPPPPFPRPGPRRPARGPVPTPPAEPARPDRPLVRGVVPYVPIVPVLPAYPPGPGPVNAAQGSQQLQNSSANQNAAQAQPGVAPREDEETQVAEEYAFSRREPNPAGVLLGAALFAGAATVVARRRAVRTARSR